MKVHYFGGEPALLGAFHRTARLRARSTSVLLCNPFGEEASRAHRIFRVMATQLERAGYSSLRFDFSNTGDSGGDSRDASVDEWLRDIGTAAEHLKRESHTDQVAIVGLRLGATLAAMATTRAGLAPKQLLLWDPVVDGAAYLSELDAQNRSYLRSEFGPQWQEPKPAVGPPSEALGFPISAALTQQFQAIDLTREPVRGSTTTVITTGPSTMRDDVWPGARWIRMSGGAGWNSDAALNAATVPMEVVTAIVTRIEEVVP